MAFSKIVSVLVILVIVLVGGLSYEYATNYNQRENTVTIQNTTTLTKTITSTVNYQCETSYQSGLRIIKPYNQTYDQVAVFLMRPGSRMQLCVSYPAAKNYIPTMTTTVQFVGNVYNATIENEQSTIFQVASLPTRIVLRGGSASENGSVTFTITETINVSGFFYLYLTNGCPPAIPFAVGYSASQINSGDFGALYGRVIDTSCIVSSPFDSATIVGTSGIDVMYVLASNQS
ncbi:MAG: hypothetical protein JRN20_17895 [Nitrososphaerota archaeon]|nr:hypothetical protein [Nitrososphaerota archaeon]